MSYDDEFVNTGYDPSNEFVDGMNLECEDELGIDYHEELGVIGDRTPSPGGRKDKPERQRQAKIKPMPQSYMKAFPNVSSMLITRFDGRQVLFVRSQ